MPKSIKALTALEVARLSKPGFTALGGVPGLYLCIKPGSFTRSYVYRCIIHEIVHGVSA